MSYPGQERNAFGLSLSTMDLRQSSEVARPIEVAHPSVLGLMERICADNVQIECDLDREEIAVFFRNRIGCDSVKPDIICKLDDWLESVALEDRPKLRARLLALRTNSTRSFELHFRVVTSDGRRHPTDLHGVVVRDELASLRRIVGHQTRRTIVEESKSSLVPSPFHDPLTGLPNRRLFQHRLADAVGSAQQRNEHLFAVFFVDLDRFKTINDRYGHLVGDRTLLAVAERLSHCVRPGDVLARRDGDEFTILVTDMRCRNDAAAVAERILLQLRSPLSVDGAELVVTASIGIALSKTEWLSPDDLLCSADEAMYKAKARGGDRYIMASQKRRSGNLVRSKVPTEIEFVRTSKCGRV